MKKRYVFTLLAFHSFGGIISAQSPNFLWAVHFGGLSEEIAHDMVIDGNGNVYTIGEFNSVADFNPSDDPNTGTFDLVSAGYQDIFVSKLDAFGNFLWAKQFGGGFTDRGRAMTLDADGNIYITGNFSGTADFDPGPGTFNLTGAGNEDIFIAKLDPSGNLIWAKQIGGTGTDIAYDIAVNSIGNVTTTGRFRNTIDFDPGPGIYNLTAGYIDIFVSTLDANGNFLWAKRMGGGFNGNGNTGSIGYALALDAFGNVYTTGYFSSTGDFDPGPETYNLATLNNTTDIFVSKLDPSGNFVWAKQMGGALSSFEEGKAILVDAYGDIYLTGSFSGTTDFNPSPFGTYTLTGRQGDVFISKLDANGDFLWAKQMGGVFPDSGNALAFDANDNVYISGSFWGTADFDPGDEVNNLSSAGEEDIFIARLDPSGSFSWAVRMGGDLPDVGNAVAVDAHGSIYAAGYFFSIEADFDPGNGTYYMTPAYSGGFSVFADAFVVKLCQLDAPTVTVAGDPVLCQGDSITLLASPADSYLWSNGATTPTITVSTSGNYSVTVSNASGCTAASTVTTVIVNPAPPVPNVTPDGPTTFCEGGSVTLTAGQASSYLWNTGAATRSITVTSAGDYWVTVANAAGCTAVSLPVSVSVQPNPVATIIADGPTAFCPGDSVVLTASGEGTYQWNNDATSAAIIVSSTGNYSVTVMDVAGCTTVVETSVTVLEVAMLSLSPNPTSCDNEDGSISIGISGGSPIASYEWNNGAATPDISNLPGGTYSVTVTDVNGCMVTAQATVIARTSPMVDLGPDVTINLDEEITLAATASGPDLGYVWSTGDATPVITVMPSGTTVFSVTVTNGFGCTATDAIMVTVITTSTGEEPGGVAITVSPNPAQDILYIKCEGRPTTSARLIDLWGRPVVFDRSFMPDGAMRTMRLDDVPAGAYFLEVGGEGFRGVVAVIKTGS